MTSVVTDEAPLGTRLASLRASLASLVVDLDPGRLCGPDALVLYKSAVEIERLGGVVKTLLAPRLDESGVWKDRGHHSPQAMMAEVSGESLGQAKTTLVNGIRLSRLPGTEAALRAGELSVPKLTELTSAGVLAPGSEQALLDGAATASLKEVRDRCQRSRATSVDPVARMQRIHAERSFSSWIDPEGAFCYRGRDTPDRGAKLLARMDVVAGRLRKEHKRKQKQSQNQNQKQSQSQNQSQNQKQNTDLLPEQALRADAFFALVTARHPETGQLLTGGAGGSGGSGGSRGSRGSGGSGGAGSSDHSEDTESEIEELLTGGSSLIDPGPKADVVVRVDLSALLRGHTEPGECCEIDTVGPIPVGMARDLANDSFLRVLFHEAGDIKAISHLGRTINQKLRTALVDRDRACVVPGCDVSYGLEIDHVLAVGSLGPTELDNLCRLCHHHHYLKTYEGWQLERHGPTDADPQWTFEPMPPFGQEPDLGLDLPGRKMGVPDPDPPELE